MMVLKLECIESQVGNTSPVEDRNSCRGLLNFNKNHPVETAQCTKRISTEVQIKKQGLRTRARLFFSSTVFMYSTASMMYGRNCSLYVLNF